MATDGPDSPALDEALGGRKIVDTERRFGGRLKEIGVSELLTFLALNRKTGKLTLTCRDGSGLVVLRNGRIIYAASSSVRETFGNILVCRKLITETVLADALERQHWSRENKRLGTVLVEMGKVRPEDVGEVVRHQVGSVLRELAQWTDGFFHFDRLKILEGGEVEVDAQDFVVAEGLNTERILIALAADLEERVRDGGPDPDPEAPASSPGEEADEVLPEGLSGILDQLPTAALRAEKTVMMLRFAARTLSRGVLFIVRGSRAEGIGHFGFPAARSSELHPAEVSLDLEKPSILSEVVQRKVTYRGPLRPGVGNDPLIGLLGGDRPEQVLAIPVVVDGRVALILYGDNGAQAQPIGAARPLELALTQAGLEIEKDALEGRFKSFERRRKRLKT